MPTEGRRPDPGPPARPAPPPPAPPGASTPARPPLSTYRLQLSGSFGFDSVSAVADYLAELGVSHAYLSPCLQAAPGSTHGYDVVDPTQVSTELGGPDAHLGMCASLARSGLGQVLDLVPNHMAISGPENRWWWDVLENGRSSLYASWFDVDWDPPEARLRNTVLLPVLGDHYGRALEAGDLAVSRDGGGLVVHYHDLTFPIDPSSTGPILGEAASDLRGSAGAERDGGAIPGPAAGPPIAVPPTARPDEKTVAELEDIAAALGRLPPPASTDRSSARQRHRDKEILRQALAGLCDRAPAVAQALDGALRRLNTDPDCLDALLEAQRYRLAYWRAAGQDLDYRRFFDISSLIGLRVEDEEVFAQAHALVLAWLRDQVVDGLRIDHIDGLADPAAYLGRLSHATGGAWVVVEKILQRSEQLASDWPVAGTTGYDFAAAVGGLFVDPDGEGQLGQIYVELTGEEEPFEEIAHQARHQVMTGPLAADVRRLTALWVTVCRRHRRYRDYTRQELRQALEEVVACFDVYRTYVGEDTSGATPGPGPAGIATPSDVARIDQALAQAGRRAPHIDPELLGFLGRILAACPTLPAGTPEAELRMRFQQLTPPVMAKAVEDTAFYVYNRLVSANEVGGDPAHPSTTTAQFHQACARTQRNWPATLVGTSTHDSKRGEDVRARISLLSELPAHWGETVRRWAARNQAHRAPAQPDLPEQPGWPDRNAEYLLYQTLIGAWPIDVERVVAYMAKATREAEQHTSWTDPDPAYDAALEHFVRAVLADPAFVTELESFVAPLVQPGRVTSLAQALCRLTAPGVPDTYQGTELWESNLVDPDNRRPVDFQLRRSLLGELAGLAGQPGRGAAQMTAALSDLGDPGLAKLAVTRAALHLRRAHPAWFGAASTYRPMSATGSQAGHVVAFGRAETVVTVVPRLVVGLDRGGGWGDTEVELPGGGWLDQVTGARRPGGPVRLAGLLGAFPVALLARDAG